MKRIIGHLDMDAFFASIEERDNPQFKGMPIAVGAEPLYGRGVVSTANYKAREYGIHSALPISIAWRLSEKAREAGKPVCVFLPPNISRYQKTSDRIFEIIKKYSLFVEPASIDEFYFDLSHLKTYKKAEELCRKLKNEIKEKEQLSCSVGIGPNKLISKISAGVNKPDGMTIVEEKDAESFLEPMSVRKIPGIGPKTEKVLLDLNIKIVKDLKKLSLDDLKALLGKWGEDLYYKSRGIDDSPIVLNWEAKSIGEQSTFLEDSLDPSFILPEFENMAKSVFKRFKEAGFKSYKTITITVRFAGFITKTSSKTLKKKANDFKTLKMESINLLLPFFDTRKNPKLKLIRLVGVRIEKLE